MVSPEGNGEAGGRAEAEQVAVPLPRHHCPNAERLITFLRRQRLPILSDD